MLLATFLLFHHLKGPSSFWYPYLSVMNLSDIASSWSEQELHQFMDKELQMDAELYASEIDTEWQ